MKQYYKIFNFLLLVILSTNISGGSFLLKNFLEQNKKYDIQPKPAALASAVSLKMMLHDFYPKNQKQPNLQHFPLEELPSDTQNEIAQYLKFKKFESDGDLKAVLLNLKKYENYEHFDRCTTSLEGRNLKIELTPNRKKAKCISKKNNETNIIDMAGGYIQNRYSRYSYKIDLAEVSPNFKKIILYMRGSGLGFLSILDLCNVCNSLYKNPDQSTINNVWLIAVADDGSFAYASYKGIFWRDDIGYGGHLKKKHAFCLKNDEKARHSVARLEFNKQGTKLGVKYEDNSIDILSIPGKEKNEKKKTLHQYFYENIITKNLQYSTSLPTNK